jgi:hypothetical protein
LRETQNEETFEVQVETSAAQNRPATVFTPRTVFLVMFALFQTSVGFQIGYVFCYTNQITPALNAKFGWTTKEEQTKFDSIIGSSAILTIMVGSYAAGWMIKKGRRQTMILGAFIGIVGTGITIY